MCLGSIGRLECPRTVRWSDGGLGFVTVPAPGDWVSLHWDFVCDVLTPAPHARSRARTGRRPLPSTRQARQLPR